MRIEFLSPKAILLMSVSFSLFNSSSGLSRINKESTDHAFPSASGFIYSGSKVGINNTPAELTYSLEVSGSIRASAGLLSNSDKRLKENIYLIDNALSKVNNIEGVYFNWKDKKETQVGVIAQQVKEVLPEVVSEDNSSYLSVDYSKLVPLLIGAVNEQSSIIEGLEKRIAKLEE